MNARRFLTWLLPALLLLASGCKLNGLRQRMYDQPKVEPLEKSAFFADGRSARPVVPGTVARRHLDEEGPVLPGSPLVSGLDADGKVLETVPFDEFTLADLQRGRERYDIFCSVCHGVTGFSDGMVVLRGYKPPPSFHLDRLRKAPVGYIYNVASNGFGDKDYGMQGYRDQVSTEDRWRIAAYVKALQLSQNFNLDEAGVSMDDLLHAGEPAHGEGGH